MKNKKIAKYLNENREILGLSPMKEQANWKEQTKRTRKASASESTYIKKHKISVGR